MGWRWHSVILHMLSAQWVSTDVIHRLIREVIHANVNDLYIYLYETIVERGEQQTLIESLLCVRHYIKC